MSSFYLIDRKARGSRKHVLAHKFDTALEVASFLLGRKVSRWIIVKNGKQLELDRAVNPSSTDCEAIKKACEEA